MSSLVEVESFGLTVPEAGVAQTDQTETKRETNLLQLAWQSRWIMLLCMLLGGGAAWGVLQKITPRYTSLSRIFVERNMPHILSNEGQFGQSVGYLYTQAQLICSTPVLAAVADDPDNADLESFRDVDNRVGFLKQNLDVTVGTQDEIINVMAELPNAKDAAKLVNAVVDAYVTRYAEQRRTNTVEVLNILRKEKERRDSELEDRRRALDEFRRQHTALAVSIERENVITARFAALAQELNVTEIGLLEAKARYNRAKNMYETPSLRASLLEAASMEQRAMRDMDLERGIRQMEQALTAERTRWGEGHPRVKLLNDSLVEERKRLKKQQHAIIEAHVDALRQEFEVQEHKRNELRSAYDSQFKLAMDVSNQALQLAGLKEALERTEKLCDILDDRIKELNLTEGVGAMNVTIMEVAGPSGSPSYPIRNRFLALGILLGGLLGFGLAWLRDLLDHRLRSVEEIAAVLQLPVLGAIPYFGDKQELGQAGRLVVLSPRSTAAESIRTLRTALHFGLAVRDVKAIVVTSPAPGDGKSTVASNLAIAMAQADQKVLLIDADMRRPTQQAIFEVSCDRGLASVLTDRRPVEEAIIHDTVDGLDILPCGPCPSNPVELLNNGFFADMLIKLREKYDRIIIDSPPIMPVADARVIAALGDATLLVLRADRSTRRVALAARNELWRVRATRIGIVVNGVPLRSQGSYGYGHGSGYGEYGDESYGGYGDNSATANGRGKRRALLTAEPADTLTSGSTGS
ncbi:MAG: polysaccharide biosynthesis tyrosine autokinase [Pirellulales bacterium]